MNALDFFAERLAHLMKYNSESIRKLSKEITVPRKSIGLYLNSMCLPRYDSLAKIADHFEVSADYLLGLADDSFDCYKTSCTYKEIKTHFVNNLKDFMSVGNVSQSQLSRYLHMQQASVSKWLRKKTMPETLVLIDLAKYFDCSVDYLLCREIKSNTL